MAEISATPTLKCALRRVSRGGGNLLSVIVLVIGLSRNFISHKNKKSHTGDTLPF